MDLPFSPHAAFIWDQTRQAIAWMNAAAQAKFGLSLEALSEALPESLTRKFAQYLDKAESGNAASRCIKLKIARHPALECCLDVLELAGGQHGLVVAEAGTQQNPSPQPPPRKSPSKGARVGARPKLKTGGAARRAFHRPEIPVPQLTPDELRSFKAIGRAVRKLCREKRAAAAPAAGVCSYERQVPGKGQASLCLPFSAFDAVLLLDKALAITGCEGRPQSFGWRKPDLLGHAAGQLLQTGEQAIFFRMVKKLGSSAVQICRETLAIVDKTGGAGMPCHAVLGYSERGGAHYFLALLALKTPRRLKKLQRQPASAATLACFAA